MDEALGALVKLTSTPVKALRLKKFMPFIQGLLDFIKALTDAQVRRLIDALLRPSHLLVRHPHAAEPRRVPRTCPTLMRAWTGSQRV